MITKKQFGWKSLCLLVFTCTTFLFLFTTCMSVDDDVVSSKLTIVDVEGVVFESDGGLRVFEIESTRDWNIEIEKGSDWIKVTPMKGAKEVTKITVSVKRNEGNSREGSFKVASSKIDKTITITQKAKDASNPDYITIKDIRDMYEENGKGELIIDEPLMLRAFVISDRVGANRSAKTDGFIQDEAGNGLAFRVKQSETPFEMGDELIINLKDAKIHYYEYAGILQMIFSKMDAEVKAQNVKITPKELSIDKLQTDMHDGTLVIIKGVQFKEYKGLNFYAGEGNATSRLLECVDGATIDVKTTNNADFRNKALPAGSGSVVAIASFCKEKWELQIRNLDDVEAMSKDYSTRFEQEGPSFQEGRVSIADLRAMLTDGKVYEEEHYIEGEVILNAYKRNVPDNVVCIADETAGISLVFSDKDKVVTNVPIGAKVRVNIKGAKAEVLNELLQIGGDGTLTTQAVEIVEEKPSEPLQPKVATMNEVLAGKYQSELVRIESVQFKEIKVRYADSPFIVDKSGKEVQVYTREEAYFAGQTVKAGMGAIVAVVDVDKLPQLLIRSVDDLVTMAGNRFDASSSYIDVSTDEFVFEDKGGKESVVITANVNWVVLNDASWLSVTPANGLNDGEITITANKNEGEERKTTITITSGELTKNIEVIQKSTEANSGVCKDLFFSEYVMGSSYNKYLEIYNGTGKTVDLSDYIIELYSNGSYTVNRTVFLLGSLKSGEVLVFQHPDATIYNGFTFSSTALNFNGDDAIALVKVIDDDYIDVDIIGCIGERPDKGWIDSKDKNLTTYKMTLVRKPSVRGGVTNNPKKGFPTLGTEWISYPIDTSKYLGSHTMD